MNSKSMDINTSETLFKDEYAIEVDGWFRRRFRNLCISLMVILGFSWGVALLVILTSRTLSPELDSEILMDMELPSLMLYGRVVEQLDISMGEMQAMLKELVGERTPDY